MKKGEFALEKVVNLILILIAVLAIILFIYFLRDKINELDKVVLDLFGL